MTEPTDLLPLKPLVFQILLVLTGGERHGWRLAQDLQDRMGGRRLLPGNLYRVLNGMTAEGLIEVREPSRAERAKATADTGANSERRRYLALTPFGREVARAEAARLEVLVAESRKARLIPSRRGN